MLYASDLFRTGGTAHVAVEDSPDELPDLVAEILAHAVEARLHRQLSLGYRSREEWLGRVRGRIDVLTTERRQLLDRGLVACRFAELTIDTPRNRFVRAALESVARLVMKPVVAHRCRSLAAAMWSRGVAGQPPTRAQMSADRFGRHDADDQFMVAAANLAYDLALPTESAGGNVLAMPGREEAWVRRGQYLKASEQKTRLLKTALVPVVMDIEVFYLTDSFDQAFGYSSAWVTNAVQNRLNFTVTYSNIGVDVRTEMSPSINTPDREESVDQPNVFEYVSNMRVAGYANDQHPDGTSYIQLLHKPVINVSIDGRPEDDPKVWNSHHKMEIIKDRDEGKP
jgi:hypothetical protein